MKQFDELLSVIKELNGPKGCPWDKKQTFQSLRPFLLEEVYELLEAIDARDIKGMVEEMGDVLFQLLFYATLGEKEAQFQLEEEIVGLKDKLIRRQPHVFQKKEEMSEEKVIELWERVKAEEKKERKHPLEGVPKTLGALPRAQKVLSLLKRKNMERFKPEGALSEEEALGEKMLRLIESADEKGIDVESALRKALKGVEKRFVTLN